MVVLRFFHSPRNLSRVRVDLLDRGRIQPRLAHIPDPVPDFKPVNDLLGLRTKLDEPYEAWLLKYWAEMASADLIGDWRRSRVLYLFSEASSASQASEGGRLPYKRLAPLLEQVQFRGDGLTAGKTISVPSLPVLGAWSLERSVQRPDVAVMACESCAGLFFGRPQDEPWFCDRPSPKQLVTCKQKEARRRFDEERAGWTRAYRAAHARKQRGTVSQEVWDAWRSQNEPGKEGEDWRTLDDWVLHHGSSEMGLIKREGSFTAAELAERNISGADAPELTKRIEPTKRRSRKEKHG